MIISINMIGKILKLLNKLLLMMVKIFILMMIINNKVKNIKLIHNLVKL